MSVKRIILTVTLLIFVLILLFIFADPVQSAVQTSQSVLLTKGGNKWIRVNMLPWDYQNPVRLLTMAPDSINID